MPDDDLRIARGVAMPACAVQALSRRWGRRRRTHDKCPKIRASEALYRVAIVQRSGEIWRIRERDGRTGPSRGTEVVAQIPPSVARMSGGRRAEKWRQLVWWRREWDSNPRYG